MIEEILLVVIALSAWSVLYKRSPIFTTWVHIQIGLTLGFTIYTNIGVLNRMVFTPYWAKGILLAGVSIPAILGFVTWLRLTPNRTARAVARWPIAALGGIAAGVVIKGTVDAMILKQLALPMPTNPVQTINTILMALTTFSVLAYFLFTYPSLARGPLGYITKSGRYLIMIAFGITMGSFTLTLVGHVVGFARDFVAYSPPANYVLAIAVILILVDIIYHRLR